MKRFTLLTFAACLATVASAEAQLRREIRIPDIPGYVTLKCDFHMHTVFSDGQVWPTVRVDEAWRLGLDAIAITDHIEYQPYAEDVPTNRQRPFALAVGRARERGILFPRGGEITRDTPPGHFNALFLDDIDALATKDLSRVFELANEQGAFTFWNHPGWKGTERGSWRDVHTKLVGEGWLHGIEVANGGSYYPEAHRWCLEKGLTMLGNSDIHGPDLAEATTADRHRTMTLVFAETRTEASLRAALFAGRTAVWFRDRVVGKKELLAPLFEESVCVDGPYRRTKAHVFVGLRNRSDFDIQLQRTGKVGPGKLSLPARATVPVRVSLPEPGAPVYLEYTVTNFWTEPDKGLQVELAIGGGAAPAP